MTRAPALLLLAALLVAGCKGEEIFLQAVPSSPPQPYFACDRVQWRVRSVRVQVIEFHGIDDTTTLDQQCVNIGADCLVRDAWSMIECFGERGYIARGIPTSVSTRIQLVGFDVPDCESPEAATVCAISTESLTGTTYYGGESVPFWFVCECDLAGCGPIDENLALWRSNLDTFNACIIYEDLDEFGG